MIASTPAIETDNPISPVYAAKVREFQSVSDKLKQLMKSKEIGR